MIQNANSNLLTDLKLGGNPFFVKNAPDPLWRIDGAWYVCFDNNIIKIGDCKVLSFGINTDPSFDKVMNEKYQCLVHSFDPFIEDDSFKKIRISKPELENAVSLNVNKNWVFHKIGIVGITEIRETNPKVGSMMSFNDIIDYIKLKDQVI